MQMTSRPSEEDVLRGSTGQPVEKEDGRLRDYQDSFSDVETYGSSDGPQDQPDEDMKKHFDDEN